MPKVKVKRKSTAIDMTPMSDVMVLLLTFFMLTTTFIQKEPVQVVTPASVSDIKIPETNVLQILVDKSGKVFLSLDKQEDRMAVLQKVGEAYGVTFTDEQIQKFKLINSFGVPIEQMPGIPQLVDGRTGRYPAQLWRAYRQHGQPVQSLGAGSAQTKRKGSYHRHQSRCNDSLPDHSPGDEFPAGTA